MEERFNESFGTHSEKGIWINRIETKAFINSELTSLLNAILEKKDYITLYNFEDDEISAVPVEDIMKIAKERGIVIHF